MTAVSELSAWLTLPDGTSMRAERLELTLDELWRPSVTAAVTIPWSAAVAAQLDPRTRPRVVVLLRRQWAGHVLLADLTAAWAALTLADLTTAWAGLTLADLTGQWRTEWESGWRDPIDLTAALWVAERTVDMLAGTITLRACSAELLAQDARVVTTRPAETAPDRVLGLLGAAGLPINGASLDGWATGVPLLPAVTTSIADTVWDVIERMQTEWSTRVWCDEAGTWRSEDATATSSVTYALPDVITCDETVTMTEWVDGVAVICTWTTTDAEVVTDYRVWPDDTAYLLAPRILVETLDLRDVVADGWPGPDDTGLSLRLARLRAEGHTLTITAPSDPAARLRRVLTGLPADVPTSAATITRITHRIPEDTMTILTRPTVEA